MTYNVFGGTLSLTQSINHYIFYEDFPVVFLCQSFIVLSAFYHQILHIRHYTCLNHLLWLLLQMSLIARTTR